MKAYIAIGLALVAIVIALLGATPKYGDITGTSYFDYFQASTNGGFKVGSNTIINGSGNISQPTSNSATSTAVLGCIQMYATSTATAVRIEFSTTTALATYSGGSVPAGAVAWDYGTCP